MLRYQFATRAVNMDFDATQRRAQDQLIDAISIAASALNTHQAWLNAISQQHREHQHREAAPPATPFQARYLEVQEQGGNDGVDVTGVAYGSATAGSSYDPTNAAGGRGRHTCACPTSTSASRCPR